MTTGHDHPLNNEVIQRIDSLLQPLTIWTVLGAIANTHAPSQTVAYTRARAIDQLLAGWGQENYEFDLNFAQTGSALLRLSQQAPDILFVAHADEFSYLVGPSNRDGSWSLIPFCSDQATIDYAAVALRYEPAAQQLATVAQGTIKRYVIDKTPHFYPSSGQVQPGDRLVYDHQLQRRGDLTRGSLDNSAGVAACLLAARILTQVAPNTPVAFAFTDEEEGPPVFNTAFGRGSRRLARQLTPPKLCVVVDGHDVSRRYHRGVGAVFAEKASEAKGAVVPPRLYTAFKALAEQMVSHGVKIMENPGYVSRSDDVSWMEITPNILLLGYLLSNPHFNRAVPSASLSDISHLAKAIVWTALVFDGTLGIFRG